MNPMICRIFHTDGGTKFVIRPIAKIYAGLHRISYKSLNVNWSKYFKKYENMIQIKSILSYSNGVFYSSSWFCLKLNEFEKDTRMSFYDLLEYKKGAWIYVTTLWYKKI